MAKLLKVNLVTLSGTGITVDGSVTTGSLNIGGSVLETAVSKLNVLKDVENTSTEYMYLNTSSPGSVVNNKAVIYSNAGDVRR